MSESNTQAPQPATCDTCAYFSALDTSCRKNPPKPFPVLNGNQMQVIGIFPPTQPSNWCGAHSRY